MTQPPTTQEIIDFYLKQSAENTALVLEKVCGPNGISLAPTSVSQLCPIPVYEEGYPASFLSVSNSKSRTSISWPAVAEPDYLQAYVKKYRRDGRIFNEIVINASSNYCWARFYAAKELIHCVTDDDGYCASGSIELVNDLIESLLSGGALVHIKPQTIVDEIAWLGAAEFLIPTPWLPLLAHLHKEMTSALPGVNAFLHIGQLLRAPELVVRHRLKNAVRHP